MGLGQFNGLGEYCGPHIASSMFLIVIFGTRLIVDTKSILDVYCRFRVSTDDLQQICKHNCNNTICFSYRVQWSSSGYKVMVGNLE